ncbi:lysophospholipase L1-like esterase [Microbacterium phyllosphaerae]|uniref:Lysophospholipase L1-like esterase n=1 Tax=Microbacterium phyllosphaerae TaxID=124798 RepID=A0ABS4WKX3_9MICO|nr:lysophospholipase L1-like esterase [Microbacterium phyllosphaerae]
MGIVVIGGIGVNVYLGADIPALWAGKVEDVEDRFPDGRPQNGVLLTGSSYIEQWSTSEEDLAPLDTVNIGIGGTKIGDHAAYVDRLVVPFHPRAIVVYAGSNDISGLPFFSKSGEDVSERVAQYLETLHQKLPDAKIFYVAVTEAPIRAGVRDDIQKANSLISEFARTTDYVTFIDTAPVLLAEDGDIDESLFGPDNLHFNDKGYEKFSSAIRPVLIDSLG